MKTFNNANNIREWSVKRILTANQTYDYVFQSTTSLYHWCFAIFLLQFSVHKKMTRKERNLHKIQMKFNSIQCWPNSRRHYIWGENPPQLSQQIFLVRTFVTNSTLSFQHSVAIFNKKFNFFSSYFRA